MRRLEPLSQLIARPAVQRGWAVGLLAAALVLIVLGVLLPVYRWVIGDDPLRAERLLIETDEKIAARRDVVAAHVAALDRRRDDFGDFIGGRTPTLAAADLLGRLDKMVSAQGAVLGSGEITAVADQDGLPRLGVRLKLSTDIVVLRTLLYAIESARPRLFVDSLDVRSANKSDTIEVTLSLDAFYHEEK